VINHEKTINLTIAHRVRELREAKGFTQKDLAEKIGTKQPSIARIESGRKIPQIQILLKIAKVLSVRLIVEFVEE